MATTLTIRNFIADARTNGVRSFFTTDYALVKASRNTIRHCRSGKLARDISKEGAGTPVAAFGYDELGHIVALCADGKVRQFLGN
jgi:hypothetical protein